MSQRERSTIRFTLNGRPVTAEVAPHEDLVEVLQRDFHLFGARESCGQGLCGCCTVLLNGKAISACLYLAVLADGTEITTVEGLAQAGSLHRIQQSFIDNAAFQCGFCTPGFELMTKQLLEQHPHATEEEIRSYLSGNLCRCGTYPEIVAAVKAVSEATTEKPRT